MKFIDIDDDTLAEGRRYAQNPKITNVYTNREDWAQGYAHGVAFAEKNPDAAQNPFFRVDKINGFEKIKGKDEAGEIREFLQADDPPRIIEVMHKAIWEGRAQYDNKQLVLAYAHGYAKSALGHIDFDSNDLMITTLCLVIYAAFCGEIGLISKRS